ncbi:hypothetical protein D3C85_1670120 [compost metagenome]
MRVRTRPDRSAFNGSAPARPMASTTLSGEVVMGCCPAFKTAPEITTFWLAKRSTLKSTCGLSTY